MHEENTLSAVETYESYGKWASVLRNEPAMSFLLRLQKEGQIHIAKIETEQSTVELLLKGGFIIDGKHFVVLSQQGRNFLEMLGNPAGQQDEVNRKAGEFKFLLQTIEEPAKLSHSELIQRCIELPSDQVAWQEFVRRFDEHIRITILTILRSYGKSFTPHHRDTVEDIAQAVYTRLLENRCHALRAFKGRSNENFLSYLRVMAHHVAINFFKSLSIKNQAGFVQKSSDKDAKIGENFASQIKSRHDSFDDEAIQLFELQEHLNHLLDLVLRGANKPRDKKIFQLHYYDGLTTEEIAQFPGVDLSPHGIEVSLSRTSRRLSEFAKKNKSK